jgi:hypothetical protein
MLPYMLCQMLRSLQHISGLAKVRVHKGCHVTMQGRRFPNTVLYLAWHSALERCFKDGPGLDGPVV